jgi:hypothetical protein
VQHADVRQSAKSGGTLPKEEEPIRGVTCRE